MSLSKIVAHYSYKTLGLASFLAVSCLYMASPAMADEGYSVDKVTVDSSGEDTTDARNKALAQGEQDAFRQLITRLSPDKSAEIIAKATPASINESVQGFEVEEERMSATHYHAVLRYHFSPQLIAAMLPQQPGQTAQDPIKQISANGAQRKAVLVIPVFNEGRGVIKLWQDDNKWRNSWYEAALESGGGLVVVPQGNINDRVDVDDTNIAESTHESLARFYDRYGTVEINILTAFYNLKADPKPALEIAIRRISPTLNETSTASYTIRTTENLEALMARAANDIAKNIYKQQTIDKSKIEYQRQKEINARVDVSSIDEWIDLRKHLLNHGNIVGIRLTSITNSQTHMIISYNGTPELLGKTLVASGLRVMQDGDSLVLALK
jgi:hypothetical protein